MLLPGPALAQELAADVNGDGDALLDLDDDVAGDDGTSVPGLRRSRAAPADPYEAQGLRLGSFVVFPSLQIGAIASSNVARANSGAEADLGLRLAPALRIESDWSRHRFVSTATGEFLNYTEHDELSSHSADIQNELRLNVRHTTAATLNAGYTLTSLGPSDREVPNGAIENRLSHLAVAGLALDHDTGAGTFRLRTAMRREVFEDVALSGGLTEDNSDRDYVEPSVSLRGTFNPGARIRPFAEAGYAPRFHDKRTDRNGLRRNSHGFSLTGGLVIDDDAVWSGEIGATVLVRDYEDKALNSDVAPGLLANLKWRPTELSSVDLSATLSLSETSSASDGATVVWSGSATVTHALRDNLDATAGLTGSISDASGGVDLSLGLRAGLEWKMNPHFSWSAAYEGNWMFAAAAGADYEEHRLLAAIILKR